MAFNWADWAIIAIIAISSLISLKRGFVREALSLAIWIVAGLVAWMFGGAFSRYLADYISTPSMQVIAACALLFVLTLLLGSLASFLLGELVRVSGLAGTDRVLGMVFGAARGCLLVVLVVGLASLAPVQNDSWWQASRLVPPFLRIADWSKTTILGMVGQADGAARSTPAPGFPE